MRRLLLVIFCLSCIIACGDAVLNGGGGGNPLSDIVLSKDAKCGEEVVIQWNGVLLSARVFLVDETGERCEAQVKVVTASGMIFIVPLSLTPGEYRVILMQPEEIEVGTITVHETDMPITGISFPSAAAPGSFFELGGVGLNDSYRVIQF